MPNSSRLTSLYSDFRHQKSSNPDGYFANVDVWETSLSDALKAGVIPESDDLLSLTISPALLRGLKSKQCGGPQALDAVFVGFLCL